MEKEIRIKINISKIEWNIKRNFYINKDGIFVHQDRILGLTSSISINEANLKEEYYTPSDFFSQLELLIRKEIHNNTV